MKEYKRKGRKQMSTRKKTANPAKEPEYKNEICDNCELSKWVTHLHQHFDHAGKPICLTCPMSNILLYVVVERANIL